MPEGRFGESNYRPEIDGLRALAVLPVILFHAGSSWIPGGFLGVDVFFVISGYLICGILLADLEGGQFSILKFYERRTRRILPALLLVIVMTFPFAWLWMPPEAFDIYVGSLWATSLFGSNVYFWLTNGYFQPAAELQPLLHTWSLAVEEQFYVAFPLLLAAAWKWTRNHLVPLFATITLVSFLFCIWHLDRDGATAFYLIHTRAWELGAGVLVALTREKRRTLLPENAAQTISLVGLGLIVTGFLVTSEADATPGWKSLFPVMGTGLVLMSATRGTWVAKFLSLRILVLTGLISYSAYLWHHPLFAFARHYYMDVPGPLIMGSLFVLTMVLAYLSWRYVEQPWRNRSLTSARLVFVSATSGIVLLVATGAVGQAVRLGDSRFAAAEVSGIIPPMSTAEDCLWQYPVPSTRRIEFCPMGLAGKEHPIVLWGDSHARALKDQFDKLLAVRKESGIYVNGTSCTRMPGIYRLAPNMEGYASECESLQKALFAELKKRQPSKIVVSMRWTLQMFPLPGAGESIGFNNGEGGIESETERVMVARQPDGTWGPAPDGKAQAIKELIDRLSDIAPVTVIGPIPEVGWSVADTNFKAVLIHHLPKPNISTAEARFLVRNSFAITQLEAIEKSGRARLVWPHKLLCTGGQCQAQIDGVSYYSDDDHLSQHGAKLVAEQFFAGH